jgi:hypothetical protein
VFLEKLLENYYLMCAVDERVHATRVDS